LGKFFQEALSLQQSAYSPVLPRNLERRFTASHMQAHAASFCPAIGGPFSSLPRFLSAVLCVAVSLSLQILDNNFDLLTVQDEAAFLYVRTSVLSSTWPDR
jgi:hypothetical protein